MQFENKLYTMEQFEGIFKTEINKCKLKQSLITVIKKVLNKEEITDNEFQTLIQILPLVDFLPDIKIYYS